MSVSIQSGLFCPQIHLEYLPGVNCMVGLTMANAM